MNSMKFTDLNGEPLALVNWHPVHCVSMNNSNTLISSDNKGYASLLFEADYNKGQLPGKVFQKYFYKAFQKYNFKSCQYLKLILSFYDQYY